MQQLWHHLFLQVQPDIPRTMHPQVHRSNRSPAKTLARQQAPSGPTWYSGKRLALSHHHILWCCDQLFVILLTNYAPAHSLLTSFGVRRWGHGMPQWHTICRAVAPSRRESVDCSAFLHCEVHMYVCVYLWYHVCTADLACN